MPQPQENDWTIAAIYDDDFGCEERPDDWAPQVIVILKAGDGRRRQCRVPDAWLRERHLDTGSRWPLPVNESN